MVVSPEELLRVFQRDNNIATKGTLSMVVQFTRMVKGDQFPLNPDNYRTAGGGQVAGLSGPNLRKILKEFGVTQRLSSEGGRTSRGSMGLMIKYVDFLNAWHLEQKVDIDTIEEFWVEQVRQYFANQPFILTADPSKTIGANLDNLFNQAIKRQEENPGTQYLGAMLQHLTAAKLSLILPAGALTVHGVTVADAPTERSGDFVVNNTVIHCTTAPGEPLIEKCRENIYAGGYPVIVTIFERVRTALDLATDAGLKGRVEVWDIKQFLSSNIHEHSLFNQKNHNTAIADILDKYNEIVLATETDPSLRIEFEG